MKIYMNLAGWALILITAWSCTKKFNDTAGPVLFNDNWKFHLVSDEDSDHNFETFEFFDNHWENVQIPHTPKLEPLVVNDQWQGTCWYRKHFSVQTADNGEKVFLKFEGAMNKAEVWLNGEQVAEHHGGYLPFTIDLSKHLNYGEENVVAVKLDNRDNPVTGPKPLEMLDFNMYGGIYRNVWLEVNNQVHITDPILASKPASGGIFVTYPVVSMEEATIQIKTHIANESANPAKVNVVHRLFDQDREVLSQNSKLFKISASGDMEGVETLILSKPKLWSPAAPNLYRLETQVMVGSAVVDQQDTRIGIRSFEFKGKDFYLNGEKTFLRGINRHQEYPFIGYALSDNAQYRDAVKIKNAGFDYVRLSHYPHSTSFMNACDELGLLVIDAVLGWQYFSDDQAFQDHVVQTSRDMIRRDRNHACVLAWEVSLNESWQPNPFIDRLAAVAHQEYPGDQCFTAGWQEYGYDIYLQARQHRLKHYNENLEKPYVVSEYGDWEYYAMNAGLSQDTWQDMLHEERSSRQLREHGEPRLLQQAKNIQEAHNDNFTTTAFADGYWVMYDYNRGYSDDLEASGIMDIFRIPKYSYYFYKSQRDANEDAELFDGGPMIFIASEWSQNSSENVCVFSNWEEVELKLNGNVVARQKPDEDRISVHLAHPPFTFHVKEFEPGLLEAVGYIDGAETTSHRTKTYEAPVNLNMEYDKSHRVIEAGCNDVFFVYIQKVDKNGTIVPDSEGSVQLDIEGDARLINPEDLKFEAGIATALIMAGDNIEKINLMASSQGLKAAAISINIQ